MVGCAETKVATWDDLAFKLIILGWNVKHRNFAKQSLEAVVLANSSSQPKSIYEAAASLFEFEPTKILMEKMKEHKSYLRDNLLKRSFMTAWFKSYNTDKDLFDTYGEVFTLKRSRDDKDKDQDPSARSDRRTKRRKSSKYAESSRDPKSKESKSTSSSKGTSRSQHKSSGKSAHAKEPSHTVGDTGVQQNQEFDSGFKKTPLIEQPISRLASMVMCKTENTSNSGTKTKVLLQRGQWMKTGSLLSGVLAHNVTSLKIMKRYDYGHLDEIEVRREDQQLYKSKEVRMVQRSYCHSNAGGRSSIRCRKNCSYDITSGIRRIPAKEEMEWIRQAKWLVFYSQRY
ncbi:hypothetical protein Tco_1344857 [Tanacetum coccineum]